MAAALIRGGRGLCVQFIHRELCRHVWRPQTALLSSKPPGPRKQPRITHIKKAKPQPAVDIPKLLEQLFAQRRPDPAAPVGKVSAARASSTKPPASSSVKTATSTSPQSSKTNPAVSASPAASAFRPADDVPTKTTPPASPPPETLPISQNSVSPPVPKSSADIFTKISPSFETTSQSSPPFIEASPAGAVSEMISPITTTPVPSPPTTTPASVEPQVPSIESLVETIEAKVETSTESVELAAAPEPHSPANIVENNTETSEFTAATVEPLIETTLEPTVDALSSPLETLESRAVIAEGTVEPAIEATVDTAAQEVQINKTDSGADTSHTALIENAIESSAMSVEATVEASALSSGTVVGTGAKEGRQQQEEERVGEEAAVEEGLNVAGALTLESVTLAEVKALVESLPSDILLHTKSTLDDKADALAQDSLVQTESGAECETAAETENITKILSERDSLSEDVEALEAETDILMEELLCIIPEAVSKRPASETSSAFPATASGSAIEASGEEEVTEVESLTLESITLAEVEARMGSLETDVLQHTKTTLEEEAAKLAKEEKMEQKTVIEDGIVSEEATEAEVLTLDSLSEATDALETETSLVLEAMFCSGPGPTLQPDSSLVGQQEVATESAVGGQEEGKVLEAMTLESVTLAEVEAVVGTLESEALTETTAQLEQEAEMLAKEEKMGEERMVLEDRTLHEEMAEALTVEALSLPEADSLPESLQAETDVLMEELLFSVPGPVGVMTENLTVQKVVGQDFLDGNVVKENSEERGSEETVLNEALTLESLTMSEVETLVETSEMDMLTETETQLETETKTPAEEMQTEQKVISEVAEVDILSEAEILTKADVLGEAAEALEAESAAILQNLLCPVSGTVTITTDATGSAGVDPAATEPDTLPLSPSAPEEVLGQKEEEAGSPPAALEEMETEVGAETETLEIHKGLDPVQRLFLEKIREYNMRRSCEGAVEAGPDFEKRLSEEKAKLQRLYGGGDLSSFPQFTFTEPKLDQDSK